MASSSSSSSSSSSTSSSFSILSAKARPYIPPQQSLLPLSSQSTLSAKAPPFTNPSPPPSSSSKLNSPLVGAPYYPSYDVLYDPEFASSAYDALYDPAFASSAYDGDDVLEPYCDFEDFYGASMEPWNSPYDGKEMGLPGGGDVISSLWRVSSLDVQGVRPKVTDPYKIYGANTCALSSHLSLSTSALEPCNDSHSYSSSNHYKTRITCSTNAKAYYPVSSHFASAQVYAPSAQETSQIADSLSKTVDSVRALPKESTTSQQVKGEGGFDGRRRANNNINLNSAIAVDSCILKKGLSSSSDYGSSLTMPIKLPKTSTSESDPAKQNNSMENSSGTLDLVDLDVDSPCWKGTSAYRQSPFHVDEVVAPHLTAVQSESGIDVAESQPHIPTTAGYNNGIYSLQSSESLISNGTKRVSSIAHSEKSIGGSFSSPLNKPEYPCIVESEGNCKVVQHFDICKEQGTDMTKDKERPSEAQDKEVLKLDQEVIVTYINSSRTADDITVPKTGFTDAVQNSSSNNQGYDDVDVTTPSLTVESQGPAVLSGKTSSAGECAQLIDDKLHCLRRNLLSLAYKDENALKVLLNDILLLVNDYHEAFVIKNKQGTANGCYDDSGSEADQSQIRPKGQGHAVTSQSNYNIQDTMGKDDAVLNHSKVKTCHDLGVQEKMQPIGHHRQGIAKWNFHNSVRDLAQTKIVGLADDAISQGNISLTHDQKEKFAHFIMSNKSDKFNNLPSDFTMIEGMANDFEKILKKNFSEQEENPRTLLHKNLWIEAQVKLFAMKYELQLARAELELLKRNGCAKGRLQEATRPPILGSWLDSLASASPFIDTGESSQKFNCNTNKQKKDDASLMAGLGVLEGHRFIDQICWHDAASVSAKFGLGAHECPPVKYDSRFCN